MTPEQALETLRTAAAWASHEDDARKYDESVSVLARALERLARERDAIGTALGEPCAECGHLDWRSDGYAERFVNAEYDALMARDAALADARQLREALERHGELALAVARSHDHNTSPQLRGHARRLLGMGYCDQSQDCPFVGGCEDCEAAIARAALRGHDPYPPLTDEDYERAKNDMPDKVAGHDPALTAGEDESAGRTENVSEQTAGGDSGGTRPTGVATSPAVSAEPEPHQVRTIDPLAALRGQRQPEEPT